MESMRQFTMLSCPLSPIRHFHIKDWLFLTQAVLAEAKSQSSKDSLRQNQFLTIRWASVDKDKTILTISCLFRWKFVLSGTSS